MGAPDKGDDLEQAPILGEELLKVDNLLQEDSLASGAGSVQDLQRKIERVMSELQTRFDQQQERFKRRWKRFRDAAERVQSDSGKLCSVSRAVQASCAASPASIRAR